MATWFWAAASGANFATNNWATSHGGSPTGQPATGDTAIFDSTSSQTCTIAAAVSLASLDCQGGTGNFAGTLIHNAFALTISASGAGAFRLSSGMTYTPAATSSIIFTLTSGTANLTSAGRALGGAISVNGVGGTVQQQDNLSINATSAASLTVTSGTWDCNSTGGFTLTVPTLTLSGSTTRTFNAAGTITLGGAVSNAATIFGAATTTNLTYNKNSANIVFLASTLTTTAIDIAWGGLTQNNVTFNASTLNTTVTVTGNLTCSNLTIGSGWSFAMSNITITISNAFTWTGTPNDPIFIVEEPGSGFVTISCPSGACTANWIALSNCQATGGATFTATNSFGGGSTTGWSITPPSALTAAAIATAVWEDTFAGGDFATAGSVGLLLSNMQNVGNTAQAVGRGTVTGSPSQTSIPTSAFTPATSASIANQLVGRVVLFDAATTTVALRGQAATITTSTASATPTLTVSAMTATPVSGDTFSVI